ncbi:MAG TPA: hypothetical protein VFT63_04610 [bacterium]|nr:hypothetical protein [bacterium]
MRKRRRILPLAVFILLGIALVSVYLFVFPARREPMAGTPYTLVIQPNVSSHSVELVKRGLEIADHYLGERLGRTITAPIDVRLSGFTPCTAVEPIPQLAATGSADARRLCINTRSRVWRSATADRRWIPLAVVAHEHFHVLQGQIGCLPPRGRTELAWLTEGSAVYVGWRSVIEADEVSAERAEELFNRLLTSRGALPRLRTYERKIEGDAAYTLAYNAFQMLIGRGSLSSYMDFCARVGSGENWRAAFTQAFGLTVDQFYGAFESSRR